MRRANVRASYNQYLSLDATRFLKNRSNSVVGNLGGALWKPFEGLMATMIDGCEKKSRLQTSPKSHLSPAYSTTSTPNDTPPSAASYEWPGFSG